MRRLLGLLVLGACADGGLVVAPAIDLPPPGSEADPVPQLDQIELSVARAGAATPLVAASFAPDEPLVLDAVPLADDLVVHMTGRFAGAEVAYGRTCPFDLDARAAAPTPRLWFSRTVHWATAPAPSGARTGAGAWPTAAGGVAVALGERDGAPITEVEVLDPDTARWTTVAAVAPRRGGVVTRFAAGRGLLLGGRDAARALQPLVEVVDPFAAMAVRVEAVTDPRLALDDTAAATLDSGAVVVMGGLGATGPVDAVVVIEPGEVEDLAIRTIAARLTVARSDHTLTPLSDDVGAPIVVIGGRDAAGAPVSIAELYRPLSEAFSTAPPHRLVVPRHGHHAARLPDGSVVVVGGRDASGTAVAAIERFTIDEGFVIAGTLPATAGLVDATLTALPDGRLLLAGGRDRGGAAVATAFVLRLDPLDGTVDVTATDDLEAGRDGHAAAVLCDGTVVVIGGTVDASAERYQPPSVGRR